MQKKTSQFSLTKYIAENVNGSNSGLDMKESYALLMLSTFLNSSTLQCNPSKATLAERCCMSLRTMNVAINSLIEKGYITHVRGGLVGTLRKPNSYTFVYEKIYACVKATWEAPEAPENVVPAPAVLEPATVLEVKVGTGNADGSKPFHSNGTRCFSFEDHAKATKSVRVEDTEDSPW